MFEKVGLPSRNRPRQRYPHAQNFCYKYTDNSCAASANNGDRKGDEGLVCEVARGHLRGR